MNNTSLWTYVFISFGKLPRRELQGHMLIVHMQDSTDRAAWQRYGPWGHTVRHDWATNTFTFHWATNTFTFQSLSCVQLFETPQQ